MVVNSQNGFVHCPRLDSFLIVSDNLDFIMSEHTDSDIGNGVQGLRLSFSEDEERSVSRRGKQQKNNT